MGVLENVKKTPGTSIALFVLLIVSFTINAVGFGSAYWVSHTTDSGDRHSGGRHSGGPGSFGYSLGLWRVCIRSPTLMQCYATTLRADWFTAVKAFVTLGFLVTLVSLLIIVLFVITSKLKTWRVAFSLVVACFATVMLNLIGIAVFRGKIERMVSSETYIFSQDNISWGFYMTCVGMTMYLVSGIVAIKLMLGMTQSRLMMSF